MGRRRTQKQTRDESTYTLREQAACKILALYASCDVETIETKGGRKLVRFTPRVSEREAVA